MSDMSDATNSHHQLSKDVREVELFVKAGKNGESLGGCPVCHRFIMVLLIKAEHNADMTLTVTTVNPARPPPELVGVSNPLFFLYTKVKTVALWLYSDGLGLGLCDGYNYN